MYKQLLKNKKYQVITIVVLIGLILFLNSKYTKIEHYGGPDIAAIKAAEEKKKKDALLDNMVKNGDIVRIKNVFHNTYLQAHSNGNVYQTKATGRWEEWHIIKKYGYIYFYNQAHGKFLKMNGTKISLTPLKNMNDIPKNWTIERFHIVKGNTNNRNIIGLWSPSNKRFLRSRDDKKTVDSSPTRTSYYPMPSGWTWERFEIEVIVNKPLPNNLKDKGLKEFRLDWSKYEKASYADILSLLKNSNKRYQGVKTQIKLQNNDLKGDKFVLFYDGYFTADQDGFVEFRTKSDDGSWVFIDGQLCVDNGGYHGVETKYGKIYCKKGQSYKIDILYCEAGGSGYMEFNWKTPSSKWSLGLTHHYTTYDKFADEMATQINTKGEEIIKLDNSLKSETKKLTDLTKKHTELNAKYKKASDDIAGYKKVQDDLKKQKEEVEKMKKDLEKKNADLKKSQEEHKKKQEELKKQEGDLKKQEGDLKNKEEKMKMDVNNIKSEMAQKETKLKKEIDLLKEDDKKDEEKIKKQREDIEKQEKLIKEKEASIVETQNSIQQKDKRIQDILKEMEKKLAEKDAEKSQQLMMVVLGMLLLTGVISGGLYMFLKKKLTN